MRACVHACVRACVRAYVRARVRACVCLFNNQNAIGIVYVSISSLCCNFPHIVKSQFGCLVVNFSISGEADSFARF